MLRTWFIASLLAQLIFTSHLQAENSKLSGSIRLDGSSTVFPISEAVAEEFQRAHPRTRVTVGLSGTGGGFKKFTTGETDISNASRPIKDEEAKEATAHKIKYIALPVAYDGLSVVVSKKSPLQAMTTAELKSLWAPGSKIKKWSDLRKDLPAEPVKLYGPGPDSGTFDYFTEEVIGKARSSRSDYTASEDDNVLVRGLSGDPHALGYFGFSYYLENQDKLRALAIDGVKPDMTSIESGKYPLSRPLFIYVSSKGAEKPQVAEFVQFYLDHAAELAKQIGYTPLPESEYTKQKTAWQTFATQHGAATKRTPAE